MQLRLSDLSEDEFECLLAQRWPLKITPKQAFGARYLDTFDWRLYQEDLLLLAEPGEQSWHLELAGLRQEQRPLVSVNSGEPGLLDSIEDEDLRQRLAPLIEMRRLLPQVVLEGERKQIALLDDESKTLVRVELINAQACFAQQRPVALPPWLRIIGLKGYDEERQQLLDWLQQQPGISVSDRFYEDMLQAVSANPGGYSAKLNFSLRPDQRADASAKHILRFLLDVIQANMEGVKADIDSEFLHDLRVAVRRTRSALSQIKEVFDPVCVDYYKQEFGWLGQITGPTRDMDVYLLKFPDYVNSLPEEYRDALQPFHRYLERHQRTEQKKLARRLEGKRMHRLLADWRGFLEQPVPNVSSQANAVRPVLEVASRRIHKMYKRVIREGRLIQDDSHPEELHELRKSCKKLRYLMEFFQSLYPDEVRGLIKSIKILLDNLGDFQDLEVQANSMKQMSEDLRQARVSTDTLLAIGMLIDGLLQRQHEERTRFGERFAEFSNLENRELFDKVFKTGG